MRGCDRSGPTLDSRAERRLCARSPRTFSITECDAIWT